MADEGVHHVPAEFRERCAEQRVGRRAEVGHGGEELLLAAEPLDDQ
ncbi:hypothetical protein [Streptomyces sp. 2224.1]|nr:hypothetical protein [Streptomyces sp. 2224.1]